MSFFFASDSVEGTFVAVIQLLLDVPVLLHKTVHSFICFSPQIVEEEAEIVNDLYLGETASGSTTGTLCENVVMERCGDEKKIFPGSVLEYLKDQGHLLNKCYSV